MVDTNWALDAGGTGNERVRSAMSKWPTLASSGLVGKMMVKTPAGRTTVRELIKIRQKSDRGSHVYARWVCDHPPPVIYHESLRHMGGTPRDGPVFRPIHVTASSRSPTKVWSDVLGGNRELTSSVDFLPKAAPPLVKLHA